MKVIFVDDSPIVLETFERLMEELAPKYGLESLFFNDATQAYRALIKESLEYDILFVDINMPLIDGFTLARTAKYSAKYHALPIVAITTEYTLEAQMQGKAAGIETWLVKTIAHDKLYDAIEAILSEARTDA